MQCRSTLPTIYQKILVPLTLNKNWTFLTFGWCESVPNKVAKDQHNIKWIMTVMELGKFPTRPQAWWGQTLYDKDGQRMMTKKKGFVVYSDNHLLLKFGLSIHGVSFSWRLRHKLLFWHLISAHENVLLWNASSGGSHDLSAPPFECHSSTLRDPNQSS